MRERGGGGGGREGERERESTHPNNPRPYRRMRASQALIRPLPVAIPPLRDASLLDDFDLVGSRCLVPGRMA